MEFAFSDEQEMLRSSARDFLDGQYPLERVAELADGKLGWDPASWPRLAELGWIGLSLAERHGGMGASFLEEAVLFEETGRALYPGPFFATVGLALPTLAAGQATQPDALAAVLAGERSATLAFAEPAGPWTLAALAADGTVGTGAREADGGWVLSGSKRFVCDLGIVDDAAVAAQAAGGLGLWRVDLRQPGPGVRCRPWQTVDGTRRLADLELEDAPATLLVPPGQAGPVLAATRLRALAALACEAVGVAQRALGFAVAHARQREQFGRPIGVYQAVSHRIADAYVALELARSLAYWAAASVAQAEAAAGAQAEGQAGTQAAAACAAAKAAAAEAAVQAGECAIQVSGGLGFTWESPLHRLYKRAEWIEAFEGTGAEHRRDLAAALLDG